MQSHRETASNLPCKHHEASPASITRQLWVAGLLPASSNFKACAVHCGCAGLSNAFPCQGAPELSIAICAPWKRGNPSTTTSSLLVSNWSTTPRSRSRTKALVRTLPPASRKILAAAFSRGNPLRPNVPTTAHADVMAKGVERTATSAGTGCEEEREAQTAEEQDPQGLRFQTRHTIHWEADEWSRSQWSTLGSEECAFSIGQGWSQTCQER